MSKSVLIVDDKKTNVDLLLQILKDENFDVSYTMDSLEVIDMVKKLMPDIILLDIMMPILDGFKLCEMVKEDYDLKDIPVIMITAKTDGKDVKNALELGAFDYIKKPIDEDEVIARINSAIRYKESQDILKEMAMKDGLTGVYNHKLLIELFEKQYDRAIRLKKNISFVMLDIDFFKKINDTYGHMVGDMILKETANILKRNVRNSDIIGRYGGEEFGIVIFEENKNRVFNICERIREEIENYDFIARNNDLIPVNNNLIEGNNNFIEDNKIIKITVSIGVYFKEVSDTISINDIISKADEALYEAKRNGKNQVRAYVSHKAFCISYYK